jgi:predicted DNA-binding transcriptional regulator YafY
MTYEAEYSIELHWDDGRAGSVWTVVQTHPDGQRSARFVSDENLSDAVGTTTAGWAIIARNCKRSNEEARSAKNLRRTLELAAEGGEAVTIDYIDAHGNLTYGRRIVPTRLSTGASGADTVKCYDLGYSEPRTFRLDRIRSIK